MSEDERRLTSFSEFMMDCNQMTIRTYMTIMAERDAAIQERNMCLEERKRAFAERDMAMLQRDAAIAERNSAIQERDEAISALRFLGSPGNDETVALDAACSLDHDDAHQEMHLMAVDTMYPSSSNLAGEKNDFRFTQIASETPKAKKVRKLNENKQTTSSKSKRINDREAKGSRTRLCPATTSDQDNCRDYSDNELDRSHEIGKDDLGSSGILFDETVMPTPVCTCTGSPQPCYRWGNGGWQSACCTTTISMYPLPQVSNKRYTRVGGRKMSGSAFSKLLNNLASKGFNLSTPIDLKDHWAKHGTNRYTSIK